ncbi:MAG: type II toxin-antitoxin system Phd/YefM family antitoxin [Anaerolineales bacterium]|nr:type II toxin-antitoxin system Phd/YefM family antitoxin [Anaerolineales bacterium]
MNAIWQIQDAKNKLSEVIARALKHGPQLITKHGEKTVVVISYAEYENLRKSQGKLSEFFRASPLAGVDLTRDTSMPRKGIEL